MEKPFEEMDEVKATPTIAQQLANLFAAGWTESQIVKFAYLREIYQRNRQKFDSTVPTHTHQDRLEFTRWLYQNRRLFS